MNQNKLAPIAILAIILLVAVVALSNSLFVTIDAGHRGVLFKRFGGGLDMQGEPYNQKRSDPNGNI